MEKLKQSKLIVKRLHQMQEQFDAMVLDNAEERLSQEEQVKRLFLALIVEVGELANEEKSFKFWKKKKERDREKILMEYSDGYHFILSIGNNLGHTATYEYFKTRQKKDLIELFLDVFSAIQILYYSRKQKNGLTESCYKLLYTSYLELGERLGFNSDDVINAYEEKNRINIQRQKEGY